MTRNVYKPRMVAEEHALPINKGGTGGTSAEQGAENLGLITNAMRDVPNGVIGLDENQQLPLTAVPPSLSDIYDSISGPVSLQIGQTAEFIITDFDSFKNYDLVANGGGIARSGNTIIYTAPETAGDGGFTINGKTIAMAVSAPVVTRPDIVNPINGTSGVGSSIDFASSAFDIPGGADTHATSDWQLATDDAFTAIVQQATDTAVNKTIWNISGLTVSTTYYVRVRHKGTTYGYSDWSEPSMFTTKASFAVAAVSQPSITNPDNGALDQLASVGITATVFSVTDGTDTHEGTDWQLSTNSGFTAIVQQLTNSASSKTSWTVSGLAANTIYYLRVRYKGTIIGYSDWSTTVSFKTKTSFVVPTINQPKINSPTNGAIGQLASVTISSSAFSVNAGSDTHAASDWQLSTNSGFTAIVKQVVASTTSKTSWSVTGLAANTTYYARVRYKGANLGYSSWSTVSSFKTKTSFVTPTVNQPSITSPVNAAVNLLSSVNFTANAFAVNTGSDTHAGSDWQLSSVNTFSSLVASITNSAASKTTWSVSGLAANTTYYARVRYKGTSYGYSAWSPIIHFTTKETFFPSIEEAILTAGNKSANALLGETTIALSADGSRMVIGAPSAASGGFTKAGQVYVFARSGNSWWQEASLAPPHGATKDATWGKQVSIDSTGTRICVAGVRSSVVLVGGVPTTDYYTDSAVFVRSGTTWSLEGSDFNNAKMAKNHNLAAISGDGSRIVVVNDAGIIVYTRTGSTWGSDVSITPPAGITIDVLASVAINYPGNRIALGCPAVTTGGVSAAGIVYIYVRSGSTWSLEKALTASDKAAGDNFGTDVDFDSQADRIVVGTPAHNAGGVINAGAAYVFKRSTSTWTQEVKLTASDKAVDDNFGLGVSISNNGDRIIVGSPLDESSAVNSGAAYVFDRSGTTWTQKVKVTPSDKATAGGGSIGLAFGWAVAVSGDGSRAGIASPGRDSGGYTDSGGAYMFR